MLGNKKLILALAVVLSFVSHAVAQEKKRLLYVVAPGVRNYLEFGGAGILVFDVDNNHKFVRRIPTPASAVKAPENIKGVCASAATKRLYFTTLTRLYCLDLATDKVLWDRALPGGCDRMSITPDGKTLYVPSLEGAHWNVIDAMTGEEIQQVVPKSGAHNTVAGLDGTRMYLAGLRSPLLTVVDPRTHEVLSPVGPFGAAIRPFTVSGDQSRVYVNVNGLLGYEVGDLQTGKMLHRVAVEGFKHGPPKRHGCPSHGVALTPDEKEVWVCDAYNQHLHIFDNTVTPPKQVAGIKVREQPGWITFSVDGKYAYPSTGEVIDPTTRKTLALLTDEEGREVHSEKLLEIILVGGEVVLVGDQFGLGRRGAPKAR